MYFKKALVGVFIMLIIPHQCFASNYSISSGCGTQFHENRILFLKEGTPTPKGWAFLNP